ncbi:hypothetical protein [Serratia microhaemolytica]|uniref:hypothetical protein n=1 Tax=Serratia microhaemolytica TaxID=2675110 RepID=UPI000FDDCF76|nr:hypothetical protein [Serratia microhaemolytica]
MKIKQNLLFSRAVRISLTIATLILSITLDMGVIAVICGLILCFMLLPSLIDFGLHLSHPVQGNNSRVQNSTNSVTSYHYQSDSDSSSDYSGGDSGGDGGSSD